MLNTCTLYRINCLINELLMHLQRITSRLILCKNNFTRFYRAAWNASAD